MAESFAKFFGEKVRKLCIGEVDDVSLPIPIRPIKIGIVELKKALKSLSNKKSFGVDEIPQNVFKAAMGSLENELLEILNDFCERGMDDSLKTARVIPLHKKGEKTDLNNYRPVSNLSIFSKVYEKCLLSRLEQELPHAEGDHQHAYRKCHSTETALLTIQSYMSNIIESKKHAILYSVDLSAAFDLLRPDLFYKMFRDKLTEGLMFAIMDFLTNRKFVVEIDKQKSKVVNLDRGCVQGSILGPKLFTLYTHELSEILSGVKVVTYADDSYVIVESNNLEEVKKLTDETFRKHVGYLTRIGMVVNQTKTEVLFVGREKLLNEIELNGNILEVANKIKALGVFITGALNWDDQAEAALVKGKKITGCFRFLRKYLTKDQFLKAASAHFYGAVFYASSVWFEQSKQRFKTKFKSLHHQLLRSACKDFNYSKSKMELSLESKRATPEEWNRFVTASKVVKIARDQQPKHLAALLDRTLYTEPKKEGLENFFDESKSKWGKQSLQNRSSFMNGMTEPWLRRDMTNDAIRILMKKEFFAYINVVN